MLIYEPALKEQDSEYFKKWGERFRLFKTLSLFALIFAILISILFFADGMTYDNIQLLVKVVDSEYNSTLSDDSLGVSYNSDASAVFSSYDGNLVVATDTELSLYNMYGRKLYSYSISYETPCIASSDELYIVYDLGGRAFSVYNKTGRIFEKNDCEYGIVSASSSDGGRFCISTKSRENTTSILVYNKKCKLIGKYENNRHVSSVSISENGELLAISTLTAEDGIFNSVLSLYKIDNAELLYTVTDKNKLPLKTYFSRFGKVILCCADEMLVYSKRGELEGAYSYDSNQLSGIAFNGDDKIALSFSYENSNTKSYISIVDISGKEIYNNSSLDRISHMTFSGNELHILQKEAILTIDGKKEISTPLDSASEVKSIISIDDSQLVVSYSTHSVVLDVK